MKRLLLTLPIIVAGLIALAPSSARAASNQQFNLSVSFVGLYPTADLDVPVTVHNPQSYALAVRTATVVVGDANPRCTRASVRAQSFAGDVTVPAGGSSTIPVRMHMLASAPDACQGATFPLTFTATGEPIAASNPNSSPSSALGGFAFTGFGVGGQFIAALGLAAVASGAILLLRRRRVAEAEPR